MIRIRYILFSICLLTCFLSCDPHDNMTAGPFPSEYNPLEVGLFWEYAVDSTYYDDVGLTIIERSSFVREQITEVIDSIGQSSFFVLERAWKKEATDPYEVTDLWKIRYERGELIRTEENLEFLSIASPIVVGETWDGILFDDKTIVEFLGETLEMFKSWEFTVLEIGASEQIGTFDFDDVLIIQQADDENLLERRFSKEKYQNGVGLVEKEQIILDTQCIEDCVGQTWEEKAEKGILMKMTLINHN